MPRVQSKQQRKLDFWSYLISNSVTTFLKGTTEVEKEEEKEGALGSGRK